MYAKEKKIYYCYGNLNDMYKKLLSTTVRAYKVGLNKRGLTVKALGRITNQFGLNITKTTLFLNENVESNINIKIGKTKMSKIKLLLKRPRFKGKISTKQLLNETLEINSPIKIAVYIDDIRVEAAIGYLLKTKKLQNYAPIKATYIKDFNFYVRRTMAGNLVLIKRLKEDYEYTFRYGFLENKFISFNLYHIGKFIKKFRKKKINLFYEKFAEKAEEGVYDLCKLCQKGKKSKNYFVIDKHSIDYPRIKKSKWVVKKYSFKYYWLIYNCNKFIASEAPSHLNLLRSCNKYFRLATYDAKFIFLQHGIIYMKNLGVNSSFAKGREAECEYMVVSSDKEKEVVCDMLGYNEENLLKTGLGMYANIDYNHINQDSDDYITIMLTWKPYEEHLIHFEESSYYQNVIEVCDMLKKYVPVDKILIISHPKAQALIENTDLKDALFKGPISEALSKTKLLITDYSSVCYNAFYQGAGVIFYQPDLDLYEEENGKLIPDNDEYVGLRAFDINELENTIKDNISNSKIDLTKLRTDKFIENYKTINEFYDGKNIERIYEELLKRNII